MQILKQGSICKIKGLGIVRGTYEVLGEYPTVGRGIFEVEGVSFNSPELWILKCCHNITVFMVAFWWQDTIDKLKFIRNCECTAIEMYRTNIITEFKFGNGALCLRLTKLMFTANTNCETDELGVGMFQTTGLYDDRMTKLVPHYEKCLNYYREWLCSNIVFECRL